MYIVRCSDNTLYTGITINVNKRIDEHNLNDQLAARYTRGRRPVELVYQESLVSRSQATKREHQIKQMCKKEKENLVAGGNRGKSRH